MPPRIPVPSQKGVRQAQGRIAYAHDTMTGPATIGQAPGVNTPATANGPQRVLAQELEERLMLARLFGPKQQPAQAQQATQTPPDTASDDVEPHLGRNVDLIA